MQGTYDTNSVGAMAPPRPWVDAPCCGRGGAIAPTEGLAYFKRCKEHMTRPTETQQEPTNQAGLRPVTTLALWSLRRSRSLLLFICLGMLVAITLVDALPLYTQVTTTAGLRSALTGAPTNADVIVHSISDLVS